jgi:hypothetical protein
MAAQTFTGARAGSTFPALAGTNGNLRAAYGSFTLTEVPEVSDIWQLCKLPKGAVPLGGFFATTDIDTGVETLDIDLGYAANGVDAADPDYFGNFGVLSGDAVVDLLPAGINWRPIVLTTFTALGAETTVQAQCIAVAAAGGTGTVSCVIFYDVP